MKLIDLLVNKVNNSLLPKLIKIAWPNGEVIYYLDNNFWYKDINTDEMLKVETNHVNIEIEIITNQFTQRIVEESKIKDDFTGLKIYVDGKEMFSIDYSKRIY